VCRRDLTQIGFNLFDCATTTFCIILPPSPIRLLEYNIVELQLTPLEELEDAEAWQLAEQEARQIAAQRTLDSIASGRTAVEVHRAAADQHLDSDGSSDDSPESEATAATIVSWSSNLHVAPGPRMTMQRPHRPSPYSVAALRVQSTSWPLRATGPAPLSASQWRPPQHSSTSTWLAPSHSTRPAASIRAPIRMGETTPLQFTPTRFVPRSLQTAYSMPQQSTNQMGTERIQAEGRQLQQPSFIFQATTTARRTTMMSSRAVAPLTAQGMATALKDIQLARWQELVNTTLWQHSQLWQTAQGSNHAAAHVKQAVIRLHGSTLARYFNTWEVWQEWALTAGIEVAAPSQAALADFMYELQAGALRDRGAGRMSNATNAIKAMRFVAKKAQLRELSTIMDGELITAYLHGDGAARDRREALPHAMAIIVAFERRISSRACSPAERIFLGTMLTCCWSSLRFGDAQRCEPGSLTIDHAVLRGLCWATKVSSAGQPFAANAFGLCGRPPQWGWGHIYVKELHAWAARMSATDRDLKIDFLLPAMTLDSNLGYSQAKLLLRPMSFIQTINLLRRALQADWMGSARLRPEQARAYTLHSNKVTVLAWSRQLANCSEADRGEQGHHRMAPGRASVRLYGRDDVHGALRTQAAVIAEAIEGWRPLRAQSRGGQAPVTEPEVAIPPAPESWATPLEPLFSSCARPPIEAPLQDAAQEPMQVPVAEQSELAAQEPAAQLGSDSEPCASSDEQTHSEHEEPSEPFADGVMFLTNFVSGVVHASMQVPEELVATTNGRQLLFSHNKYWKTGCSCNLSASCFQLTASFPEYMQMCGRSQCARLIGSLRDED
jgi:hypothetical protein